METEVTQSSLFLSQNPTFDGRGAVIAVLDTGIDPGAPGMQTTTTGEVKLIELIDCSGSGDVDMSTTLEPSLMTVTTLSPSASDSSDETPPPKTIKTVKGLTGRTLVIPDSWPVPSSGKYRVGWKQASQGLFPREVLNQTGKKRKEDAEKANNTLLTQALTALSTHESLHPKLSQENPEHQPLLAARADLQTQIELLKDYIKDWKDPGLVFDVISFEETEGSGKWWVAVDVSCSGDLEKTVLLEPYSVGKKYASFGEDSKLNYGVNVLDSGDLVSIVVPSGSHGTHVAAIAAAHFPDASSPGANGVAPGAQLISLMIGDGRFGSGETSQSLVRAAIELARLKPDVVNISYGEYAGTYDYGRFTELIKDVVINENNTLFVSSAGNAGPILSSLSHPAGNSGVITVGAYVSKQMQQDMYAMLSTVRDGHFSFTSQGPTLDGAVGVDIYAPGAAITSVPEYTKDFNKLMNGTSMACPNAAGCVSLLVSALKQSDIKYTAYRVGNALRTTSKQFGDAFSVGLVQVVDAWEELKKGESLRQCLDVLYDINVQGLNRGRGIYLREVSETTTAHNLSISIKPVFSNTKNPATATHQLAFDAHVTLTPSESWITAPEFVRIPNGGRDFAVRVDPRELAPGLHYGYIKGVVDGVGECFRVPVTVCKTEKEGGKEGEEGVRRFTDLQFDSGVVRRRYLDVPLGANFATITIKSKQRLGNSLFMIQFGQLNQQTPVDEYDSRWRVQMSNTDSGVENDDFKWSKTIKVVQGKVAELLLCQNWSALDPTTISCEVEFHGLELTASSNPAASFLTRAGGDRISLTTGNSTFTRCDLTSRLRNESIAAVSVVLNGLLKTIRPTEASISIARRGRDVLPDGRQLFQLVLGYTFKVAEEGHVTPLYPNSLNGIYDSVFESVLFMIYDDKQALQSSHHAKVNKVKLKEGTYTARMQIVSPDILTLEKFKSTPLLVNFDLKKSITLTSYKTLAGAITGSGPTFDKTSLKRGEGATFWLSAAGSDDIPKHAQTGDVLTGKFKVTDSSSDSNIDLFTASYLVPPSEPKKDATPTDAATPILSKPEAEKKPEDEDVEQKLKEEERDLQIGYIKKLPAGEKRDALIAKLDEQWKTHVPFLVAKLEATVSDYEKLLKADGGEKGVTGAAVDALGKACDSVLDGSVIDLTALAVYLGLKVDLAAGGDAAKSKKKEMDAQKAAVVLALVWKARLAKNAILVSTEEKEKVETLFDEALVQLSQWLATTDGKYVNLWAWRLKYKGSTANALKVVNKFLGDSKNISTDGEKGAIYKELVSLKQTLVEALGWTVWQKYEEQWAFLKAPPSMVLF
ncbi:subtilisin-like protein [Rhizoclosmatium globosum]|uniref:tripeptidyl-peptidase II n=1 Tax=Rhizoclosmatium globosum TaxID=329046 RepID=A0A1Y2BYH8_9FUNG|nr:subtilisin-like protein [Rhizoclosmatium globosum]|eukprot:ORY39823.1 subtilisin-like protein [Rhizoclosmatium globosum]